MYLHRITAAILAGGTTIMSHAQPLDIPFQNFTQQLYHSANATNGSTFQQRYQIEITHFKSGGPIFLLQGAETSLAADFLQLFDAIDHARELGGIALANEHRYFGTSFPTRFNASDKASYAPLTLENVLMDTVSLVKWIKNTVPGAENSPVIVTGGGLPLTCNTSFAFGRSLTGL